MNLPTPSNPLILEIQGRKHGDNKGIPSLKNNRQPMMRNGNLIFAKNPQVDRFINYALTLMENQLESSEFKLPIPSPMRVLVWAKVVKYLANPDTLPQSDLDNQYTTLQELLQKRELIVEDDRQISGFYAEEELTQVRDNQHAIIYLWVDDGRPKFAQQVDFFESVDPYVYNNKRSVSLPSLLE